MDFRDRRQPLTRRPVRLARSAATRHIPLLPLEEKRLSKLALFAFCGRIDHIYDGGGDVRVLIIKPFGRFQKLERIKDAALCDAITRAERGLIDADLGRGLIKQRVARPGQGRNSGYRTVIAYWAGSRAVFLYGFAKNSRDNIDADELQTFREIGASWLTGGDEAIETAIREQLLREVYCDDEA
jgi:hypothetical protein